MHHRPDVVVIGGGIAGVSVGYCLADLGLEVHLVEAEDQMALHSTGRSAAQYLQTYGSDIVRRVTIASRGFFADPPDGLADAPLWSPRSFLHVCGEEGVDGLRSQAIEYARVAPTVRFVGVDEATDLFPVLRPEVASGALLDPDAMELDVAAIHQAFVRGLRRAGGVISTGEPVTSLAEVADGWHVTTRRLALTAPTIVNAAGAWCDVIGVMAGARRLGLAPLRRTAAVATLPADTGRVVGGGSGWPLVAFGGDGGEMEAYCKPEPGGLLISPADETPSEPCDARADEIDVALALEAINSWTTLGLRHISSTWAGLRTFAPDRSLVAGADPDLPGFFWLAGQGGYGIQTAPALARAAAGLITGAGVPTDLVDLGVTADALSPGRSTITRTAG